MIDIGRAQEDVNNRTSKVGYADFTGDFEIKMMPENPKNE